jgi:hypothetical protein
MNCDGLSVAVAGVGSGTATDAIELRARRHRRDGALQSLHGVTEQFVNDAKAEHVVQPRHLDDVEPRHDRLLAAAALRLDRPQGRE